MNNLCRLSHVKRDQAGVSGLADTHDTVLGLLQTIGDVSAEFVSALNGRQFAARVGTIDTQRHPRDCATELWLPQDLATITSVTVDEDGDDTYELSLAVTTDYWTEREDDLDANTPIAALVINPNSTLISTWPTDRGRVRITGLWGYSYELETTATTIAEDLDVSETEVTVADGTKVDPGDTLVIDSEQFETVSRAGNTLTVVRALNGSTAATHSTGATIYRRRYPRRVEEAVKERVTGLRWDAQSGYSGIATLTGDPSGAAGSSTGRASYARWKTCVGAFKRWEVS